MAVKRRTIWLSDENWATLVDWAKRHDLTVSQAVMERGDLVPVSSERHFVEFRPVPKPGKKG